MPNKNVPALRLAGFDGEWNAVPLGKLSGKTYGGGTPSIDKPDYWSGNIPWFQSSDLSEQGIGPAVPNRHISQEAVLQSSAVQIAANSVAVVTRVGVGKVSFMPFPFATSQDFVSLSDLSGNPEFIALTVKVRMDGLADRLQGSTIKGLTKSELLNQSVYLPPTPAEQRAIAAVFTNLDAVINQQAKKYKSLQQAKTALMQRMFPQDDQTVPELRLNGFDGEWSSTPLSQLASLFTDGDWIEAKDQSSEGIRLVQTGNIGVGAFVQKSANQKWVSVETFKRLRCHEVLPGDILISRLPDPPGRACLVPVMPYRMITAVDCTIVRLSAENDAEYLVSYLSNPLYFQLIERLLAGGTRQRVSRSQLAAIEIPTPPTLEEQRAIGAVFTKLDALIAAEAKYIESLKQTKTALLQRMFV